MIPPIIRTRCCNVLLGCSTCINKWYSGDEELHKNCPHCRKPRGYVQGFQFKGIDDFLKGFKKLMAEPSAGDEQCVLQDLNETLKCYNFHLVISFPQ